MRKRKKQKPGTGHKPGIGYKDAIGSAYKMEQEHKDSRGYRRLYARWVKKGRPPIHSRTLHKE